MSDELHVTDMRRRGITIDFEFDDLGLDPYAFRVYARLVRRAGTPKGAFESVEEMAKGCRMSPRRVHDALRDLEARRLVVKESRKGQTSVFQITDKSLWRTPARDADPGTPAPNADPPPHVMQTPSAPRADKEVQEKINKGSLTTSSPTPPLDIDVGPTGEEAEEIREHRNRAPATRVPPKNRNQTQALMSRHPTTWAALCRIKNDRNWKPEQFQAVIGSIYHLADQHGERETTAALEDLLIAGGEIKHPVRWLKSVLTAPRHATPTAASVTSSEPRATLLEQMRAERGIQ